MLPSAEAIRLWMSAAAGACVSRADGHDSAREAVLRRRGPPRSTPHRRRSRPPQNAALEQLRDFYDRRQIGLILIGMPGLEKRLARYPSSTAASASPTNTGPLTAQELRSVLTTTGERSASTSPSTTSATPKPCHHRPHHQGNFRLVNRLFAQIRRIREINNLTSITRKVIETAREGLVIVQP